MTCKSTGSRSANNGWSSASNSPSYHHSWDSAFPIPKPSGFISALLVGVSAFACYVNSIDGNFVFDDSEAIVNNEDLRSETPIWNLFENDFWGTRLTHNASHKSYRPLTVLSFRWNYWLSGGLNPAGFHLTNVMLHALVSMLALPVFNTTLGGNSPRAAFLAALLFAVHPIHAEAVAGVVGRADLLCTLACFASYLCYARATASHQRGIVTLLASAASVTLATMATLCKEQGIMVIGLCSAYDVIVRNKIPLSRLLHGNDTAERRGMLRRHVALLCAGGALLAWRLRLMAYGAPVFQDVDNPASFDPNIATRVLSYNYVYALNAWLLLCPEWLCFDWSMGCVPLLRAVTDGRILAVIGLWCAAGLLAHRVLSDDNSRTQRCVAMSVAMMVVPFLPASNAFFRVGFVVAERVLYLPSCGFCLLVTLGLRQLAALSLPRSVLQASYALLIIVYGARAGARSAQWRNEATLFASGLDVCPLNAKVHYNVGKNAADGGDRALAVERYRHALQLNPRYDQAMNNLANILKDEGKLEEAEQLLRMAVDIRPDFAAAWMNLGIVLAGLQKHGEAEDSYKMALSQRRKYPDCYYNLGNLYLEQRNYAEAYRAWRNATALKPTHTVAWSNMIIMLDNIGQIARAEAVAHEALSSLPDEASLHFNLANTLGKVARFAEAEKHFEHAIRLDQGNSAYYTNLGVLYHRWRKLDKAEGLYRRALEINPESKSARDNLALLYKNQGKSGVR